MGDTPVSDQFPGNVPGNYVVSAGDTLRGIALAMFGDAQLWYLIADANGLKSDADLRVGLNLVMPNKVTNLRNAHDTFKPYEPGKIIGDTTPTLPNPPPPPAPKKKGKKGCGGVGAIVVAVVAIVATVMTAGALAGVAAQGFSASMAAMGGALGAGGIGFTGLAIAGAVGSIASQAVGMAIGVQDKFSWSGVAMGAISSVASGVAGGIVGEAFGPAGSFGNVVARSVVGNVLTQGAGIVVGAQKSFSWTSVAAAGVSAGVSYGIGQMLPEGFGRTAGTFDSFTRDFTTRLGGGVASRLVSGGRANWGGVAADAFGNALGYSIVEQSGGGSGRSQQLAELQSAVKSAWSPDWSSAIKLADAGSTMTDVALNPTEEAMRSAKGVGENYASRVGLEYDNNESADFNSLPSPTVAEGGPLQSKAMTERAANQGINVFTEENLIAMRDWQIQGAGDEGLAKAMSDLQGARDSKTGVWSINVGADTIVQHLETIAVARDVPLEKIQRDFDMFIELADERERVAMNQKGFDLKPYVEGDGELRVPLLSMSNANGLPDNSSHMASNTQLRFGKLVGDTLGIDPVFGALLSPTGGIAGPGNREVGGFLYAVGDGRAVVINHGTAHDAGGYLLNYHSVGPGYHYVPGRHVQLLDRTNPKAGQFDGTMFFSNLERYGAPYPPTKSDMYLP